MGQEIRANAITRTSDRDYWISEARSLRGDERGRRGIFLSIQADEEGKVTGLQIRTADYVDVGTNSHLMHQNDKEIIIENGEVRLPAPSRYRKELPLVLRRIQQFQSYRSVKPSSVDDNYFGVHMTDKAIQRAAADKLLAQAAEIVKSKLDK